jgi:DNA-binding LacI/PurR family transcriptional regulator
MGNSEHDIYDVAEKANVSIATVSRVLNAPDKVSETTRARVLAVIDELGFVPRADAAARARRATGRIAVVAPFFTYPSFTERLRGVATALASTAYELSVCVVDSSVRRDAYLTSLAVTRRVDGLVIMALPFDEKMARRLLASRIEVVLIELGQAPFACIEIDNQAGGRLAAQYLLDTGHQRCAYVGDRDLPDYAIPTSEWRLEGYRQALTEAGVPLPESYIALAPHGLEPARRLTHQLLDLPVPPTAIFAASDTQALGVLKATRERGVAVPRQLAVIGFDDLEVADYIGLTTIRQQLEESGRVAVELLMARLTDPSRPRPSIQLPLELVRRETA